MEFRVLGPLEVRGEHGPVALGGSKLRGTLAFLLLHANEPVSAERLAVALWGEEAPARAIKTVQVYVSRLRQALGDSGVVVTTPAGYRLCVQPDELDTQRFERLVDAGRRALAQGDAEGAGALLRKALALWRGPPLADLAFAPFALAATERLEEQRWEALEARVEADLQAGRHAELVGQLRDLITRQPRRERLRAQLMLALYRCGRQADALATFHEARRALVEELGVEPGPELRALNDAILRQDDSLQVELLATPPSKRGAESKTDGPEPVVPEPFGSILEAGNAALQRGGWRAARDFFAAAGETPEALTGLGIAARMLLDNKVALDAHERGYRLAREQGDARTAGRLAVELAADCISFRGPAEAGGWLERATRLLAPLEPGAEHRILRYLRALVALNVERDPARARVLAIEARRQAHEAGAVDAEMAMLSLEGLALVVAGDVDAGMRALDESAAAAMAGEVGDAVLVEAIRCHVIEACQRVRDFERAGEWCRRVEDIAVRSGNADLFAACRIFYGDVLVWQGHWRKAETTLMGVCRDYAHVPRHASAGAVRLAELRRRQGRSVEATALLAQAEGHPRACLVHGALALDRQDWARAADEATRYLRRTGEAVVPERVGGLELLVPAALATHDRASAEAAADELESIADVVRTAAIRAAALLARGRVSAPEVARAPLEDAAELLHRSGAPYEAARAYAESADVLRSLGREDAADAADRAAQEQLARLGLLRPSAIRARHR